MRFLRAITEGFGKMNTEIKPMNKEHFQYLKGLAILAVMVGHIGNFSGKTWFTPLGGIGVALFLFCSGFGLTKSYQKNGLKHFWLNKLISVYCPFAVVELIAAVVYKRAVIDILLELLFIKIQHPYGWYLQYLLVCYVLFYLGIRFVSDARIRYGIWGVAAVSTFVFCSNLRGEQAISFLVGVLVAERLDGETQPFFDNRLMVAGGTALSLAGIFFIARQMLCTKGQPAHLYTFLNIFFKGGIAAGVIILSSAWRPLKRLFLWIGNISYALYLVHGYFMFIVDNRLFLDFYLSTVVFLCVSFVAAIVLDVFVKRINRCKHR